MAPTDRAILAGLLAATSLLLVFATPGAATSQQSDTVKIDPGTHAAIEVDFREGPTQDISYGVEVTEGPNIDVLVMNNANYQKYRDGDSFEYIGDWSDLDTGNTDVSFTLQEHGTWWLVLDHSSEPGDGTQPATIGAESVTAHYTLESKTNVKQETEDTLERVPVPGAAVLLVSLAALAVGCARRSR